MPINNYSAILEFIRPTTQQDSIDAVIEFGNKGTVIDIEAGLGLSVTPGPSVTISLDAGISDLNDTTISNPVHNQVLAYIGGSWINQTYAGLNGASVAFTDLTDVFLPTGLNDNKVFVSNGSGTSLIEKDLSDFVQNIYPGYAIDVIRDNGNYTLYFESSKLTIVTNSLVKTDYFLGHRVSDNKGIRQTFESTPLSLFNNDENFLKEEKLHGGNAIDIIDNGTSIVIGVCALGLGVSSGGITGTLLINQGGTSATTVSGARKNLELQPNIDILPVTGPSYRDNMFGNHLTLLNNSFGLSLISGGDKYSNGDSLILINLNNNNQIITSLSISTGSGSSIINPLNITGVSIRNINLYDYGTSYAVHGTSGVSAYYEVTPEPINLLFGGSIPSNNIGFRDNLGVLEIKTTSSSDWKTYFPIEFSNIGGVSIDNSSLGTSSLLIYNGTSWINTNLTGNSNFEVDLLISGTSTILQIGACPNTIEATAIKPGSVSNTEFGYLNGLTGNIQDQLDDKLGPSPNGQTPNRGDLIYNDGTCWVLLSLPNPPVSGYLIGISTSQTIPSYSYLYDFFGTSSSFTSNDWQNSYFINVSSGSSPGYRVAMSDFLGDNLLFGTSSGLEIEPTNKQLKLAIEKLESGTSFPAPSSDSIAYYHNTDDENYKMSISDLASNLAGEGLGHDNGKLILKLKDYGPSSNLNYLNASANRNSIAGISDASGSGSSLVYSNGTSWFYVNLGSYI